MLGILCGLESEALIARRFSRSVVGCAGARPEKARQTARDLIKRGATRLMSFGIAGGLEPGLPVGTLVVGSHVQSLNNKWICDASWRNDLARLLPEAHCGDVWGSEILIPTANDKRSLYESSRCLIVDMESQCAAEIAAEANIPVAIVRAVCDQSDMEMPPVIMKTIKEDGSIDPLQAALSLLTNPHQIPNLIHVWQGMNKALNVLKKTIAAIEN